MNVFCDMLCSYIACGATVHYPSGKLCGAPKVRSDSSDYFQKLDCWLTGGVADVEKIRQHVAPETGDNDMRARLLLQMVLQNYAQTT